MRVVPIREINNICMPSCTYKLDSFVIKTYCLQEHMRQMYQEYFDAKATTIQKVWRGHYIRKHVFSFYKIKSFIVSVLQANKQKVEDMKVCNHFYFSSCI